MGSGQWAVGRPAYVAESKDNTMATANFADNELLQRCQRSSNV